ncbi:MAG: circadian clock protein KaiC [Desulfobacterales bacterium]|nr:circadian clock protein KaiC [Pseudomonadota bacterium]MCG2773682.1 circadian clock protein KaiC [Desulfobacterales bacterium]
MAETDGQRELSHRQLAKCPTGITGLDEITGGGLPRGRPTLVCGGAGCGKTLLSMEFVVRGAVNYGEPGVFMSFEETSEELAKNVASLGFDLADLEKQKLLAMDFVYIERREIQETGEYDLEGLFVRLGHAIDSVGAKRVVLDTVEALFAGFPNEMILRAELRRLFRWLKDKGVTAIITGERGEGTLTRHGIEEYVSDAVIVLDHRVVGQSATRRMRFVKYRGSLHGSDEYPFLIDETGFSVLPVTSLGLDYAVSMERITSGIPRLDYMLGGQGYFRASSVLLSGTAGSGKSSLAAYFADAACRRGERCLYLAFEESQDQIIRNMRSIGLDLAPWVDKGLLKLHATRPTLYGLEMHLAMIHKLTNDFQPRTVIMDPISNLSIVASNEEVKSVLMRLVDFFKNRKITSFYTNLTHPDQLEETSTGVSSLMDVWLLVVNVESNGERNRVFHILKSRGMAHSNQLREFLITDSGIDLVDAYIGPGGVLTGSARLQQEAQEKAAALAAQEELEHRRHVLDRKRQIMGAQVAALQAEISAEEEELQALQDKSKLQHKVAAEEREQLAAARKADAPESN